MGICTSSVVSSSEIYDDTYGHGIAVNCNNNPNGSQTIGSTYSIAGTKGLNQDSAILFQDYGIEGGAFCAVFDGHGEHGHTVSKMVCDRLPSLLLCQRNAIAKISPIRKNDKVESDSKNFLRWKEACMSAFKLMDKEIKILDSLDCSRSGTTASVVVKQGKDLVIANLGDSRAVLGTRIKNRIEAVQLTTDLKPGVPCEAMRIRNCKGRILALKEESHILRVWLPNEDSPGLAMSRAFGDFLLKDHGIIWIPDVSYHCLTPNDEFIVVASDGVWDVLSNEEVVSLVSSSCHDEEVAAKVVVDAAIASWKDRFPNSKRDDCTATCLFF